MLFQSKSTRDRVYRSLRKLNVPCKRRTTGPQEIHPQYVDDFVGPEAEDTGFGNTVYKTYFSQLYKIEIPYTVYVPEEYLRGFSEALRGNDDSRRYRNEPQRQRLYAMGCEDGRAASLQQ